jgi:hypothetical protein
MPWLTIFTEDISIREGVARSGGQVQRVDDLSPDAYDRVIVYRILPNLGTTDTTIVANIRTFTMLQSITDEAFKELYRRGIIE